MITSALGCQEMEMRKYHTNH